MIPEWQEKVTYTPSCNIGYNVNQISYCIRTKNGGDDFPNKSTKQHQKKNFPISIQAFAAKSKQKVTERSKTYTSDKIIKIATQKIIKKDITATKMKFLVQKTH